MNFEKSVSLINTGIFRSANKVLKKQSKKSKKNKHIYHQIRNLVPNFLLALKKGDIKKCGKIITKNWELKKKLDAGIYLNKFKITKLLQFEQYLQISEEYPNSHLYLYLQLKGLKKSDNHFVQH